MTIPEFLGSLKEQQAKRPGRWRIGPHGGIRDETCRCPIEVVADFRRNTLRAPPHVFTSAMWLGLSLEDRLGVISASDCTFGHSPQLRNDLLEACGISCEQVAS